MQDDRKKIVTALKKARTSIDRIIDQIDKEDKKQNCFDVIQQNLAIMGLLRSANTLMLGAHIDKAIQDVDERAPKKLKKMKEEIIRIVTTAQNK